MKTFILTEKPSVARDFAKALGIDRQYDGYMENDQYIITWAIGHLVELLEPEDYDEKWKKWRLDLLPIIPEQFRYKPISRTEKQLKIIKDLISKKSFDKIVIATDAGREGEVIARTILFISGFKDDKNLYRFWTSQALTPDVVKDGMNALKKASEYDRLWKAGQSRQIADWLVGMNGSRAATIRMNDLFSIGRVQTAVLSLLVDRRRIRENFKPEPYWILRASFYSPPLNKDDTEKIWWGIWFKEDESRFLKEEDAIAIQKKITDKIGKVHSVKKQKKNLPPPFLYSLTDLQQDGNKKFGFSAEMTLNLAQSLYEEKKCLSYPRTDSKVLGSKNVDMTKHIISSLSKAYPQLFANIEKNLISGSNKRVFNDAKLTDHHALIPLKNIPNNANSDEKKLYDLVLKRFAAAFHPDCEYEQTEIITEVEKERFRTTGKRILKPGWQVVYDNPQSSDKKDKEDSQIFDSEEEPEYLPKLAKGDQADVKETNLEKKQTTPPPEYSEALLLKDMTNPGKYVAEDDLKKIYRGDVGLGTQATRAQIIETLLSRKYAERKKKNLIATDKGCHLIETLRKFNVAKNLTSPEETARWEQQLHLIAQGKGSDTDFLDGIKSFIEQTVEEFKKGGKLITSSDMGNCPICGGKIIEGKRGFGCSKWRKEDGACRFVIWKNISGKIITPNIVKKLIETKEAGPFQGFESTKDTKNTNDKKRFKGILKLVKNKEGWDVIVEPVKDISDKKSDSNILGICPACGGNIVEREKGYGCDNWRNGGCKFIIWKTIAKKEIPKEAVIQLLESGITEKIDGFVSKQGKQFSARLKIQADGEGSLKAGFDF